MKSGTDMKGRENLIQQLRYSLEASEDTEHLIDWLEDAWSTLDMLRERFAESRYIPPLFLLYLPVNH